MTNTLHGPISCVTFDWGDTLAANYGMPYAIVHKRALQELAAGITAAGGTVADDWLASCSQELDQQWRHTVDPQRNPEHHEFDYDALLTSWLERCGCQRQDPRLAPVLETYGRRITDTVVAYDRVTPTLAALKDMGLRLGILSHVPWPGWACRAWHQRRGWADYFDFYSLSSEVGVIKPNPRHYAHAQELAQCPAAAIVHVGDHPLRDVQGGNEFGLQTVLKHTQGIYPQDDLDSSPAGAHIAHVDELPDLLAPLMNHPA